MSGSAKVSERLFSAVQQSSVLKESATSFNNQFKTRVDLNRVVTLVMYEARI